MTTVKELKKQIQSDIQSAFLANEKKLIKFPLLLEVLSTVFAYIFFALHRKVDYFVENLFLQNVKDGKVIKSFLEQYDISLKEGEKAKGQIKIILTNKPATIEKDTAFFYELSTGTTYSFFPITEHTFKDKPGETPVSSEQVIDVIAEKVGGDYNLPVGTELTLANTVANVQETATVEQEITGGTDPEDLLEAKNRLLSYIRVLRTGGTVADYKMWALNVDGVRHAFVYSGYPNPNQVTVHFLVNSISDYLPTDDKIDKVKTEIEKFKPIGIDVLVNAPTKYLLDLEIRLIVEQGANNKEVEEKIKNNLRRFLLDTAKPGEALFLSQLSEVISGTTGEVDHTILKVNDKIPSTTIEVPEKNVAVLAEVVFKGSK